MNNNISKNNINSLNDANKFKVQKIILITTIIGAVCLCAFLYLKYNANLFYNNGSIIAKEQLITNKDYLYDTGVEFIKNKWSDLDIRKEQQDFQVIVNYYPFGITSNGKYDSVYMWVLSESYFVDDDKLFIGRTNSSLYKILFKDDVVVDYQMPNDGKDYERVESYVMENDEEFYKSLSSICNNKDVLNSIINYKINLSNNEHIHEHYNYLTDFTIYSKNLNNSDNYSNNNSSVPYPSCIGINGSDGNRPC